MSARPEKRYRQKMYANGREVYCAWCCEPVAEEDATVEHNIPKWNGGHDRSENFLIACKPCNHVRGEDDAKTHLTGPHPSYTQRIRLLKRFRFDPDYRLRFPTMPDIRTDVLHLRRDKK